MMVRGRGTRTARWAQSDIWSAPYRSRRSAGTCALAHYTERIALAGLAGLGFSEAPPMVRPHGGTERRPGTNPVSIAGGLGVEVPESGTPPVPGEERVSSPDAP